MGKETETQNPTDNSSRTTKSIAPDSLKPDQDQTNPPKTPDSNKDLGPRLAANQPDNTRQHWKSGQRHSRSPDRRHYHSSGWSNTYTHRHQHNNRRNYLPTNPGDNRSTRLHYYHDRHLPDSRRYEYRYPDNYKYAHRRSSPERNWSSGTSSKTGKIISPDAH